MNLALVPPTADDQELLPLWKWLNSRTLILTGMEGTKITYKLDANTGDGALKQISFVITNELFLPQF